MRMTFPALFFVVLVPILCSAAGAPPDDDPNANTLTDAEKAAGWKLLFDGKTTDGWHRYSDKSKPTTQPLAPTGWTVENGVLSRTKSSGDLVTDDEFENFELTAEWKISPGGNSGIIYRCTEDHKQSYETGPEYQVLDNTKHADGKNPLTSAASAYAMYAPSKDLTQPVGQWNLARIVVNGNHVEHWLNGEKVVEYEWGSDDWTARMKNSKFKDWPDFGKRQSGHIDLQDHGNNVWYRNVKIRVLK